MLLGENDTDIDLSQTSGTSRLQTKAASTRVRNHENLKYPLTNLPFRAFIAKHGIEAYRERIAAETARANAVLRAEQVARDLERLRQTRPAAT
jgi:hypothetical protein